MAPMLSLAARVSPAACAPGRYLPESTPCASGDQTICETPLARAERDDLLLRPAPQQRILRLAGDESAPRPAMANAASICCGDHSLEADIARLALAHDLAQRLHGLFQRRVRVVAVALVEVDVIGAQALQRGVDLLDDLGARQALVGRRSWRRTAWWPARRTVARPAGQRLAQQRSRRRRGHRRWRCR